MVSRQLGGSEHGASLDTGAPRQGDQTYHVDASAVCLPRGSRRSLELRHREDGGHCVSLTIQTENLGEHIVFGELDKPLATLGALRSGIGHLCWLVVEFERCRLGEAEEAEDAEV